MDEKAGMHIGSGFAWMGFWLMIGLANFGEEPIVRAVGAVIEQSSDESINQVKE